MDPNQNQQSAPTDALEQPSTTVNSTPAAVTPPPPTDGGDPNSGMPKKPNAIKQLWRKINVYFLMFIFVVVIAGIVATVSYLNSKKEPPAPSVATQQITQDTLDQLANSDATVGGSGQTLTVQGNAVFSGQVLVRGDLGVAGSIKLSSPLNLTNLTVSAKSNLSDTQATTLQVSSTLLSQGNVTFQKDLNVAGASSFGGPVNAGQLTVTKLILSGSAVLTVPNHLAFTGAPASRGSIGSALGSGGSASVNGSDTSGTVNINTGNSPAAGCFVTINFAQKFSNTPRVIVSPVGAGAGLTSYYVTRTTTNFSICAASNPPGNQAFAYDYFVTGS